jgi:hypothetical protein
MVLLVVVVRLLRMVRGLLDLLMLHLVVLHLVVLLVWSGHMLVHLLWWRERTSNLLLLVNGLDVYKWTTPDPNQPGRKIGSKKTVRKREKNEQILVRMCAMIRTQVSASCYMNGR